jgi:DNA-binding GntR family transcriptional regulator
VICIKLEIKKTRHSIRDAVYDLLRQNILDNRLEPGAGISENEISEKLKVSRTPVREAFLRLAQEGLLEVYPQKGTIVSLIDIELVEEARFMREQLERAVVRLACERFSKQHMLELESNLRLQELCRKEHNYTKLFELDEQFHRTLFEGCGKSRTWQTLQLLKHDLDRTRMLRLATNYNWDDILMQHRQIIEGIQEQDADRAESIMKQHLSLVIEDQEDLKKKYPNYFK